MLLTVTELGVCFRWGSRSTKFRTDKVKPASFTVPYLFIFLFFGTVSKVIYCSKRMLEICVFSFVIRCACFDARRKHKVFALLGE